MEENFEKNAGNSLAEEIPNVHGTWNGNEKPQTDGTQQVGNGQSMDGTKRGNRVHIRQDTNTVSFEDNRRDTGIEDGNLKRLPMDNREKLRMDRSGATVAGNTGTLALLGWISAALTFLISPRFSIPGVIFGVMVNRDTRGRGNAIIITNVVLAALGMILGLITTMLQY